MRAGTAEASPRRRQLVGGALAIATLYMVATAEQWHFLDNVNLPIHETGHLVFAWGGEVLTALGGTLFQLIVPALFAFSFHRRGDPMGVGAGIWWVGQNCLYIARYLADAPVQELPLVGGGEHDWAFLLAEWNLLHRADAIARAVRLAGVVGMAVGAVIAWQGRRPAGATPRLTGGQTED
ncbi:MAG: hypothetical protein IPO52_08940 [Gemmatimonadetes bacterium]|nr:hypothetical protein [Gemmatimonadota bacterium]